MATRTGSHIRMNAIEAVLAPPGDAFPRDSRFGAGCRIEKRCRENVLPTRIVPGRRRSRIRGICRFKAEARLGEMFLDAEVPSGAAVGSSTPRGSEISNPEKVTSVPISPRNAGKLRVPFGSSARILPGPGAWSIHTAGNGETTASG
jgi:hypothetical protein